MVIRAMQEYLSQSDKDSAGQNESQEFEQENRFTH